ncbi:transposase [Paraburkholderia elongata]|uniref:Transposase n=1 Tax=Paraburkholderia elongata TaxID=2675747 RepID=A0A972P040_9BURK|nr:transposase [Paraburkholderia elongata]
MDQATPGRGGRFPCEKFRAQAVEACRQPGVSMASVAMANGINANLLRRWAQLAPVTPTRSGLTVISRSSSTV